MLLLFKQKGLLYEVEIVDFDGPIEPTHSFFTHWILVVRHERLHPILLTALHRTHKNKWTLTSPFAFGRNLAKAKATLVVMVQLGLRHNWTDLAKALGRKFNPPLEVEFLPGRPFSLDDGEDEAVRVSLCSDEEALPPTPEKGRALTIKRYPRDPAMGASIGQVRAIGGAALGGFVYLTIGDHKHRDWLTNHHVIRANYWTE